MLTFEVSSRISIGLSVDCGKNGFFGCGITWRINDEYIGFGITVLSFIFSVEYLRDWEYKYFP